MARRTTRRSRCENRQVVDGDDSSEETQRQLCEAIERKDAENAQLRAALAALEKANGIAWATEPASLGSGSSGSTQASRNSIAPSSHRDSPMLTPAPGTPPAVDSLQGPAPLTPPPLRNDSTEAGHESPTIEKRRQRRKFIPWARSPTFNSSPRPPAPLNDQRNEIRRPHTQQSSSVPVQAEAASTNKPRSKDVAMKLRRFYEQNLELDNGVWEKMEELDDQGVLNVIKKPLTGDLRDRNQVMMSRITNELWKQQRRCGRGACKH